MTIKVWRSYSCNNSSSYRLVAKFATPAEAEAVAAELRAWFPTHSEEMDNRGDYSEEPSEAQRELGARYGFTWDESLYWGDSELTGDEPEVFTHDHVLIVQHTYCGGLGDLGSFVKARGASTSDEQDTRSVEISVLFRAPAPSSELDGELAQLFEQLATRKDDWTEIKGPWQGSHDAYGKATWFRDTGTVGLYMPIDPRDLATFDRWLTERGVDQRVLQIDEPADRTTFAAIGGARCTSCGGPLDYLDPRLHDIETPQLVCKPCGGLYELATFLPAKS